MHKYLILFFFVLSGCIIIPNPEYYPDHSSIRNESGALVQGSKLWNQRLLSDKESIRIVDGPITVNYLKVSKGCQNDFMVGINDTYGTDWYWIFHPGMEMQDLQLYTRNNQTLIVKTSDHSYDGDCYVTWRGYLSW